MPISGVQHQISVIFLFLTLLKGPSLFLRLFAVVPIGVHLCSSAVEASLRIYSGSFAVQIFVLSLQICVHLRFFLDRFWHSWLSFCLVTVKNWLRDMNYHETGAVP